MSERRTSGTGFGLWVPTPCTVDTGSMFNRSDSAGAALRPTLGAMARFDLWPTPTVNGNNNQPGMSAKAGWGLRSAVNRWRTPNTVDSKGETRKDVKAGQVQLTHQVGGALNPTWVEWLMGWPLGWTDLKPSATGKCPSAPLPHGECLLVTEATA